MGSAKFLAQLVTRAQSFRRISDKAHIQLSQQEEQVHRNEQHDVNCDRSEPATNSGRDHERRVRRFEAVLAVRVQQLQLQGGGGGGSAHLNWLLDACAATLSTHSSLAPLLLSLFPPPPASSNHDRRADEVLSLLDLCTSLKHMADDVDRQLSLLQRALHSAGQALQKPQGGVTTVQSAAHRLRACLHGLQFLSGKQYKPLAEAQAAFLLAAKRIQVAPAPTSDSAEPALTMNYALDGTLLISLLLLSSTLSSFAAPINRSSGATRSACKLIARYVSSFRKSASRVGAAPASWVGPLRQLQRDLKQEEMSCVFLELQRLQASAASLHDALLSAATPADDQHRVCSMMNVGELRHSVESLRKSSLEAQACISALRSHLASLFQSLLAFRLALLIPADS